MAIERIPLAQPIESRDGTLLKDSYTSNAVFETRRGKREFVKRPGLINIIQVVATTPPAYVTCNGLTSWNGFLISVIGNTVYKTGYTGFIWATSTLGTMTAGTRAYFSASLLDKYLVVHNGFGINIVTLSSGVLSVPTTPPPGNWVPGIAYLNNAFYVAVGYNNSIYDNRIYNSNPTTGDPNTWNASSYVTFYQTGDTIVGICKHLNYIVVFGNFSTQFFYDNGANQPYPASPLAVAESYTNEIGCADGNSVVATNNTVLWVGTSKAYGKSVYMMDGVSPIKISTNYVDKFLEVVSTGTKGSSTPGEITASIVIK